MGILRNDIPIKSAMPVSEIKFIAKLDQNESPIDIPFNIKEAIFEEFKKVEFNRYPQPKFYYETKEIFSSYIDINPKNFLITVGADQAIWLSFFIAGGKDKSAVIYEPTYPIFKHAGKITQTNLNIVNLGVKYEIDPNTFKNHNIITIVNPNNPTGNLQNKEIIYKALECNALIVIDEAYYPFSGITYKDLIYDFRNLYIIRSLSKSLLAGIRIGLVIADEEIVNLCEEVLTTPYHISILQLVILRNFHLFKDIYESSIIMVNNEKEKIYMAFDKLNIEYVKSYANFILFKVNDPNLVYDKLLEKGIRIRNISYMKGLESYLRVTVGKPEENELFIRALQDIIYTY
ncbi:MAG: aminotransferase class I/II-fold pyridoxal phosphate-dependent enzyme [candidate division WOR-3 bacterium]|nr:aminotransferase class I/II-fold pyridoxal phosphate-dependent enzyme [candidate division WOR-3 bacterium]MDW8150625.1 aminotransferase class I/II-fold pyridoxal phosphate-dependent enzyme [candidate division WOR-3 bacterium]